MYFRGPIYSLFNALTIEFPDKYDLVESEVEGTKLLYYAPKDSEVRVQIDVLSFRAVRPPLPPQTRGIYVYVCIAEFIYQFVDETDERRRFPVLERCQKLSKRLAGKDDVGKYMADIIDLFMFKISALNNPERKAEKLMHDIQDTQRFLAEIQGLAEFPSGYAKWIREELEKPDNECTSQFNDMANVLWQLIDGKEDEEEEEDQEEEEELF